MPTTDVATAVVGAPSSERQVLIAGGDLVRIGRYVPALLRANYSVRRATRTSAAAKEVRDSRYDLVVVVLPLDGAAELLAAVRAEGSASGRAALLLVEDDAAPAGAGSLAYRVNRALPADCSPEELEGAAGLVLNAAPRVPVDTWAIVHLGLQGDPSRRFEVEDLSSAGMLLTGSTALPVSSAFGFELMLPAGAGPARGRAEVVRRVAGGPPGKHRIGARFLAFGGDGAERLANAVFQQRAAAGAREWTEGTTAAGSATAAATSPSPVVEIRNREELARRRAELAQLTPLLEELLRKGLASRLQVADWYVTGAELGLESLQAYSAILEAAHSGRARGSEVTQILRDLADLQEKLGEFADPRQDVKTRIDILLHLRRPLERILGELALAGAAEELATGSRPGNLVATVSLEIQRLLGSHRFVSNLPGEVSELARARFLLARRALRRRAGEICRVYSTHAAALGLSTPKALLNRRGRRQVLIAAEREIDRLERRLAAVHRKVYTPRFRDQASGDPATDLAEAQVVPITNETLAAGTAYLMRAYSAYRHALELVGADPGLLLRAAGLTAAVTAAERRRPRE